MESFTTRTCDLTGHYNDAAERLSLMLVVVAGLVQAEEFVDLADHVFRP